MERRPALLVLFLAFGLLGLIAAREAAYQRQFSRDAQSLGEAILRHRTGPRLSADELGRLAGPLGFSRAQLNAKDRNLVWELPPSGSFQWPIQHFSWGPEEGLSLALERPASQWGWHLGWSFLTLLGAIGIAMMKRGYEDERLVQRSRLDQATSGEAGALQRLQRRLDMERRLAGLHRGLRAAGPARAGEALEDALRSLAKASGADRALLFQYSPDGSQFSYSHGWGVEGVRESGMEGFSAMPTDAFPWWRDRLRDGQTLESADLSALPEEAAAERYLLQLRGVKAFLIVPVDVAGRLLGFAGLVRVFDARAFDATDRELMEQAGPALAEFLSRVQGEERAARLSALERCIAVMAARLLEAGGGATDGAYESTLAELAAFTQAGRIGLWVLQADGGRVRLHSEWVGPTGRPTGERDRELAAAGLPMLLKELRVGRDWSCPAVDRLEPDWDGERIELRRRGVEAAVVHGIYAGGHLLGWLQLERLGAALLSDDALLAAAAGASIFAAALRREGAEAALRASEDRARALLAGVPDALLRFNAEGRVLDARLPKGERLPLAGLLGQDLERLHGLLPGLATGSALSLRAALANALRSERPQSLDLRLDEAEGPRYLEWRLVPQGREVLAVVRDRSQERRQELEHERQLGNLLAIFNAGSRGFMLLSMDGRVQAFNQAADASAQHDLGVHLQAGMRLSDVSAPEAGPIFGELMRQAAEGHEPVVEQEIPLPGGRGSRLMRVQCLPVFGAGGEVRAICMSMDYLDAVAEAREALRVSEERYKLAALGSKDGLWDLDLRKGSLYVSKRLESMLGLAEGEGPKSLDAWVALAHPDDRESFRSRLDAHLDGRTDHFEAELRLRHAALADPVWMLLRGMAVRDAAGKAIRVAGSQTDIHLRKQTEDSLLRDALQDPLTGLPNRAVLLDRLGRCQARARRRKGYHYALLYLDTDDFKTVNQSLGAQAGDRLLRELASRLEQCLRPGDTVGRLGGDEFALILDDLGGPRDAELVAQRVLESCQQPILMPGRPVYLTVSLGIALSGEDAPGPAEMLRDAETAMVHAKAAGRSGYRHFNPDMLQAAVTRLDLVSGLREALAQGQFRLHYQPIVDLNDGRMHGMEALARWEHPQRGLIMPGEFIPAAEESGLILPLGRLVLKEGIRQLHQWLREGAPSALTLSINLSPRQLEDPELLPVLETVLKATPLPEGALTLEVTESVFMSNRQAAAQTLARLSALGARIAIDDFGTGYSSLSYLHQFPAQVLKIDRSFIARMDGLPENEAVTSAVITLGRKLGLGLVAEGIETPLQAARLRALGCDLGQGYLFSRPQPPAALPPLWAQRFELPPPLAGGPDKP
jgi:diguanylate cyclase (GGDEF)-like protein/PAS domain S-box-containing protein